VSCGQNARFALSIVESHLETLRQAKKNSRTCLEPRRQCSVTREIIDELAHGAGHLYITGDPGLGKSEVVDWFIKSKNYWKSGEPSSFLFGTLNETAEFIWFEDFDIHKFSSHLSTLLSLMDHKEVTISKKCVDDRTIVCPARHIYISNYAIPVDYPMFLRRVKVITVSHRLYECEGCQDYPNNVVNETTNTPELLFPDLDLDAFFSVM